nr:immunoglobulin light chain junction region [Macaca mulatta]
CAALDDSLSSGLF